MQIESTVAALAALAQEHRLTAFRALVAAGAKGMAAGEIADALGLAPSSLSFHLKALAQAGLVRVERQGRVLRYRADFAAMRALVDTLTENCCANDDCGQEARSC